MKKLKHIRKKGEKKFEQFNDKGWQEEWRCLQWQ